MADTESRNTAEIGRRIAQYRKAARFGSAAALAAAIPDERVTTSVIQNIESGRKSDLAVRQLLAIADVLNVSPGLLVGGGPVAPSRAFHVHAASSRVEAWADLTGSDDADRYSDFTSGWDAAMGYAKSLLGA